MIFIYGYIFFTFFPVIYKYAPFFGKMRIVYIFGVLTLIYLFSNLKNINYNLFTNRMFFLNFLFIFSIFMSIIFSYDRGISYTILTTVLKYTFINIAMLFLVSKNDEMDGVLISWVLCSFLMAVFTIINYAFMGVTFEGSIRGAAISSGIFADPNDLALFLNASLPVMFYLFYKYNKNKLLFIPIMCVVFAVILSYSRGGFLGLSTVLLGLIFLHEKERLKNLLLTLAFLILFVLFAPDTYKARLSTVITEAQIDQQTSEYPGRLQAWIEMLPHGFESPLFGSGAGVSHYLAFRHIGEFTLIHNTFIQVFLEMGLFGLGTYLLIYLLSFKQYKRMKVSKNLVNPNLLLRQKFLILSLISFAVTAMFLPQAYSVVFVFMIGLLAVQQKLVDQEMLSIKKDRLI